MHPRRNLLLFLIFSAVTISGILLWKAPPAIGITNGEEINLRVSNSLAELNLPDSNNLAQINDAPNNLSNYLNYRSGVSLSQTNKDSLKLSEQKSWAQDKKVSQTQLAQIMTDVAFERLTTLSDPDISSMAETLRGFNDPGLPAIFGRSNVLLRANGEGSLDPQYFISQLAYTRNAQVAYVNGGRSGYPPLLLQSQRAALYNRALSEISSLASRLSSGDPAFLGNSTNQGLTPSKALLVTYAVVSNDMLIGNSSELQQSMQQQQQTLSQYVNSPYPGPSGHHAYGVYGYRYSSPTNVLLDDTAVARVIGLIAERSNLQ